MGKDNNKGVIFVDIDGTLLDVSEKYFAVYSSLLSRKHRPHLSFREYWTIKRKIGNNKNILQQTHSSDISGWYEKQFASQVETEEYLHFDILVPGVIRKLQQLKRNNLLIFVCGRKKKTLLKKQLATLRLLALSDLVLVGGRMGKEGTIRMVLKNNKYQSCASKIYISDTPGDLSLGKKMGFRTIGVLTGLSDRERLDQVTPDEVLASITKLTA
jgi:phosphoglycolate phosphatase-like HAD superfamily hydrolase